MRRPDGRELSRPPRAPVTIECEPRPAPPTRTAAEAARLVGRGPSVNQRQDPSP
ncbi:hypothetical protein KCH_73480 [Kitasatospora cheerisanensis KCTC 2395]|uniref:Uncharacterized protein n=1 Tax=Kitasatospora cheerisanensis KCTC 2395 TaxID=1348663 RepID=A0A066YH91_9ACTN|nr:hypothetical protein KCH_73480 [Kitasatospora cheerisanensis KCTC 2395]